ncbi:unnamed protein product, partial [Medioppia subpectinata]
RQLPRPADVNNSILRTGAQAAEPQMSAIQRAEELIKKEMLVMLHYDAVHNPTDVAINPIRTTFLEKHPYVKYSKDQLAAAKLVLQTEMDVVKQGMAHTELTLDGYCQVWDESLSQVLYLPSQHKYTRANLVNKKDRIESLEKRLDQNRSHMTKEAKKAAKIEKKLRILLGGYQSRAAQLTKQTNDLVEQVEQTTLELQTFTILKDHEEMAIDKRIDSLSEDVKRQNVRESSLQERYDQLIRKRDDLFSKLKPQPNQSNETTE